VALMLGALMGVAAIAADIGRFYVVAGELQTSADAAALKGAAVLQLLTSNFASAVDDSVLAFANNTNRADGSAVVINADSVDIGWWEPGVNGAAGSFSTTVPNGKRANAVSVKAYGAPLGVFSQMIGRTTGLPLERRAVAWIGNVSLNCVRPFAFPYGPFYKRVNNLGSIPANPIPDLDPVAFAAFQNTSVTNRTMIVLGRGEASVPGLPDDGNWEGYNLPNNGGGNSNASQGTFETQIESCGDVAVNSDAANGKTVPNNGNGQKCNAQDKIVCGMVTALQTPNNGTYFNCAPFRANDAGCYASATATLPGVQIDMAWGDYTGNGSGTVDFRYVAEFQLMCVFSGDPNQTCGALTAPNNQGYPPGTVVGVALGLKSRVLNPTDVISNAPSNVQRLFLVK
jgi:hypothetical protein